MGQVVVCQWCGTHYDVVVKEPIHICPVCGRSTGALETMVLKRRYITGPLFPYSIGSLALGTAGRVYLIPIDIPWPVTIDRIIYQVGTTSAGNVRVGIYREGPTADSPTGGVLVVESASVAQSTANYLQLATVADTVLTPGQYFVGIQGDDVTGTLQKSSTGVGAAAFTYDRAGGYGAFTNPCPTASAGVNVPYFALRVKEDLPGGDEILIV